MRRVLIVDDALFMRYILRKMLENNGYDVVGEAEDGFGAVEQYKQLKPDVVTMDITMPDINGIKAIKLIKALDNEARIIVISALGYAPMITSAIMAGASDFIIKPFQENNVLRIMNRLAK